MTIKETTTIDLTQLEIKGIIKAHLNSIGYKTDDINYNIEEFTDNDPCAKFMGITATVTKITN